MGALIAAAAAALRPWVPRTYVRVDDADTGGTWYCDLAEAAENVHMALHEQGLDGEPWDWREGHLVIGRMAFTFVRLSPRRFRALNLREAF